MYTCITSFLIMIGSQINQYQLLDQLGEGGMGVVYLAEDTRLHRKAALKFISGSTHVTSEERKRFNREARAAARLSHPNICTVYELGENEEQAFIALEYVEGETLKDRMRRGNISNEEIHDWLQQMAEGLHAAHEEGVIHRDVKPANIMITPKGHIKIMDFGIAKLSEVETELTQANSTIGTIAYMSPEQARGEKVDQRTDIWALGVIMYELTTGKRPFPGAFREAVMYAMMHEDVPTPSTINPDVSKDLEHIINKCLQRERENRYGSLDELLLDLNGEVKAQSSTMASHLSTSDADEVAAIRSTESDATGLTWSTIIDTRQKKFVAGGIVALFAALILVFPDIRASLSGSNAEGLLPSAMHMAVLPFDTFSEDPEGRSFSNGLAHLVATNLLRMKHDKEELWIIPVREVLSRNVTSAGDAREKFGINLAVSGTIVELGNAVQITLDVTDARSLRIVASQTVELSDTSPGAIQDQVVLKLAELLEMSPPQGSINPSLAGNTDDPEAYKLYIQGVGFMQQYQDLENVDRAIQLFEKAIAIDSTYVLAYAAAGFAYTRKFYFAQEIEQLNQAVKLHDRAMQLNDQLAEVWITGGRLSYIKGEIEQAIQFLERALELAPESYEANRQLASYYAVAERYDEAEALYNQSISLQPNYWDAYNALGIMYSSQQRFEEAIEMYEHSIRLSSESPFAYHNLALGYFALGDTLKMIETYRQCVNSIPTYPDISRLSSQSGHVPVSAK